MNAVGASAGRLTAAVVLMGALGCINRNIGRRRDGDDAVRRRHRLVNSNSPLEVFSCLCEKKLQAVGDIGFRGAGFKVDGADIGEGIFFAEPPDDAFPGNVVGQCRHTTLGVPE